MLLNGYSITQRHIIFYVTKWVLLTQRGITVRINQKCLCALHFKHQYCELSLKDCRPALSLSINRAVCVLNPLFCCRYEDIEMNNWMNEECCWVYYLEELLERNQCPFPVGNGDLNGEKVGRLLVLFGRSSPWVYVTAGHLSPWYPWKHKLFVIPIGASVSVMSYDL